MDSLSPEKRSKLMSRIRGNCLKPELAVAAALCSLGYRAVARNPRDLPGSPDFVLERLDTAIFVHGCYWHGCPAHYRSPKSNTVFWRKKLDANRKRDARCARALRRAGWSVLTVWEHDTRLGHSHLVSLLRSRVALATRKCATRRAS